MLIIPIQFETVFSQGFMAVAVYIHYFSPGSLRIHTNRRILSLDQFEDYFGEDNFFEKTRKWLQMSEAPYPGYCRAPGSSICIPALCNCDKLTELWRIMQQKRLLRKNK